MASGRNVDVDVELLLGQRDWLRHLARHLAGKQSDGDDLAQDAWLAVHRSPPDPKRPPRPWLAQVLRNLIQTRRRDDARRARRERDYRDIEPDRACGVDEIYDRLELHRFVVEQVMALEEPLRTVVLLRYFEGLDSAGIARLTGIAPGTVRWRLKTALERLRRALDARHGGDRRAWVVVLISEGGGAGPATAVREPSSPAAGAWVMTKTKTKAWWILSAGVGLLAISGGLIWRAVGGAEVTGRVPGFARTDRGDRTTSGLLAPLADAVPRLAAPGVAPSEQTAAGCAEALAQARDEAQAVDREVLGLVPVFAFDAGAPNGALREQVLPQIERHWPAAATARGISYRIECRGWACVLSVLVPSEKGAEVEPRLQTMGLWMPTANRLRDLSLTPAPLGIAVQWVGHRPAKDPLTGKKLLEHAFFFGAPPGASEPVDGPAPPTPLPASLDLCRRELAAIRERLRPRLALLDGFRPSATLFAAGASSPELTARVQAAVDRVGATARAECRSGICRLRFEHPLDPAILARLRDDEEIGERILKGQQSGTDLFVTIGQMGGPLLMRVLAPRRKASFFAGCPEPEREGNLLLRLRVPETGLPNEEAAFGRASVQQAGGTLAGSPAAGCLIERMAALLSAHPLPRPMVGHLRLENWTWRPGQPPRLVTIGLGGDSRRDSWTTVGHP